MEFGVFPATVATEQEGTDTTCTPGKGDRALWFKEFFKDLYTNPDMKSLSAIFYWQEKIGLFPTRLYPSTPEASVWQQEIKANPNYWHSTIQTQQFRTK